METPLTQARILIIDDEEMILTFLSDYLKQAGHVVECASRGSLALQKIEQSPFDLVLLDLKLPDIDGLEILRHAMRIDENLSVIIMTAYPTVESAVTALKLGAEDFLFKPVDLEVVGISLAKVLRNRRLRAENALLHERIACLDQSHGLIFCSKAMKEVLAVAAKVSALPSTVLIQGESGTGKELIARAIHNGSPRTNGPFVAVNCAVIPAALLESDLFGHERGSFTGAHSRRVGYFEAATGGTILLDEISETSLDLQAKLLRVLQERTFRRVGGTVEIGTDARVIVCTNRDLAEEVHAGGFREDLYYRLNVIPIKVPPLRKRPEDIPLLVHHFVAKYSQEFGRQVAGVSPAAMDKFLTYLWPGNVRELENTMQRAVALCESRAEIDAVDVPEQPALYRAGTPGSDEEPPLNYARARETFERSYLNRLLLASKGNIAEAARLAGLARQNIYVKLRKHNPDE